MRLLLLSLLCLPLSVSATETLSSIQRCESRFEHYAKAGLIDLSAVALPPNNKTPNHPPENYRTLSQAYKQLKPHEKVHLYGSYTMVQDGVGMIFTGSHPVISRTEAQLTALLAFRDRLEQAVRTKLIADGIAFVEARRPLETHGITTTIFYILPDGKSQFSQLAKYVVEDMDGLVGFDPTAHTLGFASAEVLPYLRTFLLPNISNAKIPEIPHELTHLKTEVLTEREEKPYFSGSARMNFRGTLSKKLNYYLSGYWTRMSKDEPLAHAAELHCHLLILKELLQRHPDVNSGREVFASWIKILKEELIDRYIPMLAGGLDINSQQIDYITHYDYERSSWLGSDRFNIYADNKTYQRADNAAPFYYVDLVYEGFGGSTFTNIISDPNIREQIQAFLAQHKLTYLTGSAGTLGPASERRSPQNGWGLLASDLEVRDRVSTEALEELRIQLEHLIQRDLFLYDGFMGSLLNRVRVFEKHIVSVNLGNFSKRDVLAIEKELEDLTGFIKKLVNPSYYLDTKNQNDAGVSYEQRPIRMQDHKIPDWILNLKNTPLDSWNPKDISSLFSSLRATHRQGDPNDSLWLLMRDKQIPLPIAKAYVDYICEPTLANLRKLESVDLPGHPASAYAKQGHWGGQLHRSERYQSSGN